MRRFIRVLLCLFTVPARHYFWGGLLIVLFTSWVVVDQVGNRWNFAGGELRQDVMARWGAPIGPARTVGALRRQWRGLQYAGEAALRQSGSEAQREDELSQTWSGVFLRLRV